MSTDTQPAPADRQRARAFRRNEPSRSATSRTTEPPRQRRPALAALALVLIVGGALAAGLLAVRMDERETVLAAARPIPAGAEITVEDLKEVPVASDGIPTVASKFADVIVGSYATVSIQEGSLVAETQFSTKAPVAEDRAEVSVPINPALVPASIAEGDLVQIVRSSGGAGGAGGSGTGLLGEGYVLRVNPASADELGGSQSGSLSLLVPEDSAAAVVDAAGAGLVGLAILERGQSTDVELAAAEQ